MNYHVIFICPSNGKKLNINGVSIIQSGRIPVYVGVFFRALWEIVHSMKAMLKVWLNKPNIVIITIPSMFLLVLMRRDLIIVDIRNLVWEYLPENTNLIKLVKSIIRSIMLLFINKADVVIETNEKEQMYISSHVKKTDKMTNASSNFITN